jgi:serine/threonine protein kinase
MKDLVGQTLGQYRIETALGSGRVGQVFRGKHVRLGQPAAIKVVHDYLSLDPTFRARFLQDARSIAALRHPHIVEVYEFGEQDGLFYLTMELMTEGTLSMLLRQRAIKRFEALIAGLDIVRQAAEGLAAAHALGMIHRDIKPDNLLLNRLSNSDRGGEQYQLKISDFGLARLSETTGLTRGDPVGTPVYMSPEQCQDKTLDERSDLYSLGVVLYEVVTGYLPFQINSFSDAVQKHVNAAPLSPREVRPDLPPFVEQIILRCLAKRPEDRYQTGTELAKALQQAINNAALQTMAPLLPASPNVPPSTKSPRIRVVDLSGQTIQIVEVTRQGLTIGRQHDCDIVLSADTISRRHLQVKWDGKQTTVTDLRSSYGAKLGNEKLVPQVSRVWETRQTVSIGPFLLHLEAPEVSEVPVAKVRQEVPIQPVPSDPFPQAPPSLAANNRIGIRVEPTKLTITPGEPYEIKVTLVNLGRTVDWFTPVVEGVDEEWVRGQGQEVHLNPGMQKVVELRVKVPRVPESYAQEYSITILASSRERPGEFGSVHALWTVRPFRDDELKLAPGKTRGRGTGNYTVTIQNNGNISERYELSCEDAEQKLTYHFRPDNEVRVEPGKLAKIPLKVKTRRFWLGNEQPHPFQIHATPAAKRSPQTKNAEFVNRALLPNWLLPVAAAIVIVALALALLIPRIFNAGNNASTQTTTPGFAVVPTVTPSLTATPTPEATATPTTVPTPTSKPNPASPAINFTSFTDANANNLQLNGSAKIVSSSSVLRLTPVQQDVAGSAYSKRPIDPSQSFQTHFQFLLHGGNQADGIAFIVQSSDPNITALGGSGGNIGYGGISPSLEVEFDTFKNPEEGDPDDNHIGIMLNGDSAKHVGLKSLPPTLNLYESRLNVWIDYDALSQTLQVYIDPESRQPSSPVLTARVTANNIKSAFVGFTGATGGFVAAQDILNWQFSGKFASTASLSENAIYADWTTALVGTVALACLCGWEGRGRRGRTGVSRVGKGVMGEGNPCPYECLSLSPRYLSLRDRADPLWEVPCVDPRPAPVQTTCLGVIT